MPPKTAEGEAPTGTTDNMRTIEPSTSVVLPLVRGRFVRATAEQAEEIRGMGRAGRRRQAKLLGLFGRPKAGGH